MRVKIQESAKKELKKIDKHKAKTILKKLKELEAYPHLTNIKKLKNHYPPFRYRVGDYRVLFDVDEDVLIVIHIKHRKEAY